MSLESAPGEMTATVSSGRGRRRGAPDTRGAILAAAREEFGVHGYDGATVRGIAGRAGVDAALVHHYFGTKERLFAAAMQLPINPAVMVPEILAGPREEMGERGVRLMLGIWGDEAGRGALMTMLGSAMTNEAAATMMRQFVGRALLARVAAELDLPDAQLRVGLVGSHLVGLAILRYVLEVEPLASASEEEIVRLMAPTIQRYLTP